MIPKVIHQTWKTNTIPKQCQPFQKSWQTHHPDWEYRFWTDADNRAFIAQEYEWFLPIYDSYDRGIKKADAVRYLIMHHYGGVYVDLDFECLQPLNPLLEGKELIFGLEPLAHVNSPATVSRGLKKIVCNAFIASCPQHQFWEYFWEKLVAAQHHEAVLDATGVYLLTRAYEAYPHPETISLLPPELVYPVGVRDSSTGKLHCENREHLTDKAFAIHHWHSTWFAEIALERAKASLQRKKQH
ncbi:MAG: glycosyltransferase [Oscillatoria sp. PMC 1068.18]|nr:glycosyltransferase [Oscillatoria sp. PMC 1076.18]MEC4988178.1 glycosyltransferase [Oscillatoria sp. PMC 1068.18]